MTDIKIVCGYVRKVEKLPTLEWLWTLICNAILIHYVNSVCNSWHNYLMVPISRPKITSYATDNYKTLFSKLLTVMPGHNSSICHSKLNTAEKNPPFTYYIYTHLDIFIEPCIWHIEAETKWPPFLRRRFQVHYLEWKYMKYDTNCTEVCS